MSDENPISALLNKLHTNASFNDRLEATRAITKLRIYDKMAIEALQKINDEQPYSELGKAALEAIDSMYLSNQIKRTQPSLKPVCRNAIEVSAETSDSLATGDNKAYCKCNFCGKETEMTDAGNRFLPKLSGPDCFYCCFCLRHCFNQKDARHTLMLTFRGIIGYFFYAFYNNCKGVQMTISEINDYIANHVTAGTQNPLFAYDPETYVWFLDFRRIGRGKKQLPIQTVLTTISEIILTFDLFENVKDIKPHKVYLRYEEAIFKFYHQRSRPQGSKILAPTLFKTGASDYPNDRPKKQDYVTSGTIVVNERKKIDYELTRTFHPSVLKEAIGRKY